MKRLLTFVMVLCLLCSLAVPFDASAAIPLDQSIDGLNNTSLVILPAGNTGTNYPKGKIVTDNYTEGDGSLYSNWPAPASGSLAGTQNGINISLVGVGGSAGLNIAAATYVSFDLYLHGVSFTSGKDALLRFGSQASWNSTDLGSVYFTDQAKNMKEGWNHFTIPLPSSWSHTSVKNIWIAFDNSCTAVTLTANDAYVLLDDVRLLNDEGKAINDVRNQAKPVIAAIAKAYKTSAKADITAARNAYNSLSAAAKAYVTNLDKLEAASVAYDKQFRSLDTLAGMNGGNGTQSRTIEPTNYMEGKGAGKWEYTAASSGLFWYVYCDNHTTDTVGMDISGAEYIVFDFFVSNASAWTLAGDTRINFRDSTDGWNSKAGQVTATNMNNAFKAMKTGWNHVALPIDRSAATVNNVWAFRMYFASGTAPAGFYTMIDDIRFVSASYVNSQHYADTIAAKDVAAQIGSLPNSASAAQIHSVQNAYFALTDAQRPLVANIAHLNKLVNNLSATSVNIQYRHLNSAERTSQEAATTTETTTMRVEGTGAAKFVHAVDRTNGLYWYVYCESSAASTGTNIAGATHITFDFYVSDPSKWSIGTADMRLSVRNVASTTWDNSCTQVSAANMKTAFSNVKQGWNHIVMPLESLLTNDAFAFRMYMTGGSAKQGFYTIIDDVRFVNRTYLASADYTDRIAAKKVSGLISQLTSQSGSPQISAARTAYNALTTTQQGYVCNYDWLTAYEAGNAPAGSAQQTFQTIPSSHLGNLAGYAKGEFSLAILSDLHYAVNWNSQQKDIYFNSMKYILDRADSENTLMTIQLGDMTSGNRYAEWLTVREGFQMLVDGGMPYATTIGNHDIGSNANAAYNAFLPYSEQVAENPYLAGAKEEGKTDNLYYTFKVNGVKYMVLVLACYPKDAVLSWADQVVKAHSDYNVILVTHSYLQMKNGTLGYTEEVEALAAGFKGINVWNNLIKGNPNIFMTFSAHNSYPEPGKNGVGLLTSKNDAGRNVYQFLVPDPQNYENTYGGLGSLFMLRFSNAGKTVTGEYIATRYNKDFIGYGTNNFSITFDPIPDYTAMAKAVDDKIAALPSNITLSNEAAVTAARSAYNA
ncbi:MAG: metallophosphoesterase, partial [Clostridia bacterium]|nr:metallophosphoesterase [Clostridia bacterium]